MTTTRIELRDMWSAERSATPESVSMSSACRAALISQPLTEDMEMSSVATDTQDCFHEELIDIKSYMRPTISSRAKWRSAKKYVKKGHSEFEPPTSSEASLKLNKKFVSKIPHAPGVCRRNSLDSARMSWRAESVFSMTDTARETHSGCGGGPPLRCSNAAVERWLDGCESECGQVPMGDVHKICLTRSHSGKGWVVFTDQDMNGEVGAINARSKPESPAVEEGVDIVKPENDLEGGSGNGCENCENDVERENESRGERRDDSVNCRKGPFGFGHLFTFLLGLGTMTVLGALK